MTLRKRIALLVAKWEMGRTHNTGMVPEDREKLIDEVTEFSEAWVTNVLRAQSEDYTTRQPPMGERGRFDIARPATPRVPESPPIEETQPQPPPLRTFTFGV